MGFNPPSQEIGDALLTTRGTGVTSTYVSSVTIGGTTFAQPAVVGEIYSDEGYFAISYAGATGITVSDLTSTSTYVYIDKNGALQQQTSIPTRQDWSRKMFTMRVAVNVVTEKVVNFQYISNPIGHYANSIRDLYTYLRAQGVPFKIGQTITGRTDNLGFNIGAGSLMEFGGTGNMNDPNIRSFDAVSNTTYFLFPRTSTATTATNLVKFWDNAGTITALGSTTCVAHRVYRFSSGTVAIQYGQGNYANMALAKTGAMLEEFVVNPSLENATFMGWWLLEETATATSGTVDAEFVEYTIGIQGGTSSTLSGCLLKGNNLSDLLDTATAFANIKQAATTSATGVVELAVTSEIETGTDSTRAMPVDQFVASDRNIRFIDLRLVAAGIDVAVATTVGGDFEAPFTGTIVQSDTNKSYLCAYTDTAGTTGTMVVDVHLNGSTIMTTNKLDIETTEKSTSTAATQPDLTTTAIAAGDILTFDIDAVHTTEAKGLTVRIPIRLT